MLRASCLTSSMRELRHDRLTQFLAAACLLLALMALLPKVAARPGRVQVLRPPITVSIEGEVKAAGSYQLEFGARVADLIELAGGFTSAAARSLVALAAPLTDGQVVQVPALTSSSGTPRVSVNSADITELQELPGIGPVMAARIVAARPFNRVDDLLRVPGIGPATLSRLRHLVAL